MKELVVKKEGTQGNEYPSLTNSVDFGIYNQRYKNYVPIDLIKAKIVGLDLFPILDKLDLVEPFNIDTGEIVPERYNDGKRKKRRRVARYKNMIFTYVPDRHELTIKGSLHSLYNGGGFNYNDFNYLAFKSVLKDLYNDYGIHPSNLLVYRLEWGLNVEPPIKTNLILKHCLLFNWKRFDSNYNNCFKEVGDKTNYTIKIYNKSAQFDLNEELIRIERKQYNWLKFCKQKKIGQTLFDLIKCGFKGLRETLLKNWNDIIFYDPLIESDMLKVIRLRDVFYWEKIKLETSYQNHSNKRKYLKKINKELGGGIQEKITDLMEKKLDSLSRDVLSISSLVYSKNTSTSIIDLDIIPNHYGMVG